ncbi:MAG: very short patch repair endonuclease [Candidatus Helarchaeota archaeon]
MDNLTREQRKKNMQSIRSKDTKPEQMIMNEFKRRKIYFAKHVKKIFGNPDIVFRRKKIVVFIDSDFWHGHPERYIAPKTNVEYWKEKIERNKRRDQIVNRELSEQGWRVIRLWEYDIKRNLEDCINKILDVYYMED